MIKLKRLLVLVTTLMAAGLIAWQFPAPRYFAKDIYYNIVLAHLAGQTYDADLRAQREGMLRVIKLFESVEAYKTEYNQFVPHGSDPVFTVTHICMAASDISLKDPKNPKQMITLAEGDIFLAHEETKPMTKALYFFGIYKDFPAYLKQFDQAYDEGTIVAKINYFRSTLNNRYHYRTPWQKSYVNIDLTKQQYKDARFVHVFDERLNSDFREKAKRYAELLKLPTDRLQPALLEFIAENGISAYDRKDDWLFSPTHLVWAFFVIVLVAGIIMTNGGILKDNMRSSSDNHRAGSLSVRIEGKKKRITLYRNDNTYFVKLGLAKFELSAGSVNELAEKVGDYYRAKGSYELLGIAY